MKTQNTKINPAIKFIAGNGAGPLLALCNEAIKHNSRRAILSVKTGKLNLPALESLGHLLSVATKINPATNGTHCQGEDYLKLARGGHPIPPCRGGARSPDELQRLKAADTLAQAAWYLRDAEISPLLREAVGALCNA